MKLWLIVDEHRSIVAVATGHADPRMPDGSYLALGHSAYLVAVERAVVAVLEMRERTG